MDPIRLKEIVFPTSETSVTQSGWKTVKLGPASGKYSYMLHRCVCRGLFPRITVREQTVNVPRVIDTTASVTCPRQDECACETDGMRYCCTQVTFLPKWHHRNTGLVWSITENKSKRVKDRTLHHMSCNSYNLIAMLRKNLSNMIKLPVLLFKSTVVPRHMNTLPHVFSPYELKFCKKFASTYKSYKCLPCGWTA